MTPVRISPPLCGLQISQLGDQLLSTNELQDQRNLIERATASLLDAESELWLDERLFRLPGLNQSKIFPDLPPEGVIRRVLNEDNDCCQMDGDREIGLALRSQELTIGAILVRRPEGGKFRKSEIEGLEVLAGHAALALIASHRFAVEQWRLEQLILVRKVSAQIANVLDLNTLTRRITRLDPGHFQILLCGHLHAGTRSEDAGFLVQRRARKTKYPAGFFSCHEDRTWSGFDR